MVVDTAHRLNEPAFAVGDARLAEWASRHGQRALPGDEGLYCDLALAKLRQDDVDGFTAVRREAGASAAALDALDGLQPEKLKDRSEVATIAPAGSVTWMDAPSAASAASAAVPGWNTLASEHSQGDAGIENVTPAGPMVTGRRPNK